MAMKTVHPYLNFAGNTEEAFTFYRSVFGGEFTGISRFRDMGGAEMGIPEDELDRVANMGLPLANGVMLMGTDTVSTWQTLTQGNNAYIMLDCESAEEAQRLFSALSAGGRVEMELQKTEWAKLYASFVDRFGVQWMVYYE
jgi:PhnB protein